MYFQTKRHSAAPLKENKTFFVKKNVKVCHNQVKGQMKPKSRLARHRFSQKTNR